MLRKCVLQVPSRSPTEHPSAMPTEMPSLTASSSCSSAPSMTSADVGQPIGAPGDAKVCMITAGSATTACQYYVRYSADGGNTWLGLTFEGVPGGTGCAPGNSDFASSVEWLRTKYIAQGYCCAVPPTVTPIEAYLAPSLEQMVLPGAIDFASITAKNQGPSRLLCTAAGDTVHCVALWHPMLHRALANGSPAEPRCRLLCINVLSCRLRVWRRRMRVCACIAVCTRVWWRRGGRQSRLHR